MSLCDPNSTDFQIYGQPLLSSVPDERFLHVSVSECIVELQG